MGGAVRNAAIIAWSQSQIEGIPADKYKDLAEGLTWRWNGKPLALAGRPGTLLLTEAMAPAPQVAGVPVPPQTGKLVLAGPEYGSAFVVTDGERIYSGLPVLPGGEPTPLLVFHDGLPPAETDLTIIKAEPDLFQCAPASDVGALLCFTPGTEIMTPQGPTRIEDLAPGDLVMTRDNGAQHVVWMGHRRMSAAQLYAQPKARPVRLRGSEPYEDLVVSPDHRILRRDRSARALWGEDEILVRAGDLLDEPGVEVDQHVRETYYISLMLEHHEVIYANGVEVESFHPGFAGFEHMTSAARDSLLAVRPDLAGDPFRYGPPVRRQLSQAEAEILRLGPGTEARATA